MIRAIVIAAIAAHALLAIPLSAQRATTGGARLSGVIQVDDTSRAPVRGAIVTVTAPELSRPRSTITDASGAFAFANLPAGRFALTATKPPFLMMAYGGGRPGRQGTSITLAASQDVNDLVLRLPRGGVITGTLRDQTGAPIEGVTVSITRPNASVQRGVAPQLPSGTTDDRGTYRIFGLMPGDYYVAATFRVVGSGEAGMPSAAELDRRFAELGRQSSPAPGNVAAPVPGGRPADAPAHTPGFALAPTFFPGTTNPAEAVIVTVNSGEERPVDFTVGPARSGIVDGVIRTADGSPLPTISAALDAIGPSLPLNFGSGPMLLRRPTAADGRFRFGGVTPGKYVLSVTTASGGSRAGGPAALRLFAVADVTTTGDDVVGLTLTLEAGQRLAGTVKFDGALAPPDDLTGIRLTIVSNRPAVGMSGLGLSIPQTGAATLAADGTFAFTGLVPGPYTVLPLALPGGWVLQSAIINGRDGLETPFDVTSGADIAGAILTFSDKHTELSGTLRTAGNAPATEYFVVTFPTDQSLWKAARRLMSTRPASDGLFTLRDLPAGEYFLAALTDVTADDLKDASFLSQIVPGAIKVTISDGEKRTQDLKIGR